MYLRNSRVSVDYLAWPGLWKIAKESEKVDLEALGFVSFNDLQNFLLRHQGKFLYITPCPNSRTILGAAGVTVERGLLDVVFHFMKPGYERLFRFFVGEIAKFAFEKHCYTLLIPCLVERKYGYQRKILNRYAKPKIDPLHDKVMRYEIDIEKSFGLQKKVTDLVELA